MHDQKQRAELAERVERRRQEISRRSDVSQAIRKLSTSSSRNPTPLPRKRSTTLTLLLGGLGAVAVVALVLTAILITVLGASVQNSLNDPSNTADKFFSALHQKDYQQAYSYLSPNAQAHLSEAAFANQYGSLDATQGIVDSYTLSSSRINGGTATITMLVVRRGNLTVGQQQTLTLIQQNGNWLIDGIALGGTIPAPTQSST
jgi:hypothetical protein